MKARDGVTLNDGGGGVAEEEALMELTRHGAEINVTKPIALVGLMGAGKSTIGRRLASVLHVPFLDADVEIVRAAGLSVSEIFERHGECEFRRGERLVIARLLNGPPHVLATGGGAYMDPETRENMREKAVTVWLKAPLDVLMRRVERRDDRPLLQNGDARGTMMRLMEERYPIYSEADIVIETTNGPHHHAVAATLDALRDYFGARA